MRFFHLVERMFLRTDKIKIIRLSRNFILFQIIILTGLFNIKLRIFELEFNFHFKELQKSLELLSKRIDNSLSMFDFIGRFIQRFRLGKFKKIKFYKLKSNLDFF